MALLVFDGFEVAPNLRNGNVLTSGAAAAGTGRVAGKSIGGSVASAGLQVPLPSTAVATTIVGVAWLFSAAALGTSTSRGHAICLLGDAGATEHLSVSLAADGKVRLYRGLGGVLLATSTVTVVAGVWHYFEVKATIADAGGVAIVKVDGVEVINFTGDTKNAGTLSGVSTVSLPISTNGSFVDDLYVCDATGGTYNDFLGDRVVKAARPDGAGASTGLTPSAGSNYQCVDEDPWTTADYVSSGAAASDLYTHADVSGFSSVDAVQVVTYSLKTDAGVRTLRTLMRSSLGTIAESADLALTTTVATVQGPIRQTDPDAAPLTQALVNSAQYGVKVV